MRYRTSPSCLLFLVFKLARDGAGSMRVSEGLCNTVGISRMRRQNAHMLLVRVSPDSIVFRTDHLFLAARAAYVISS